MTASSARYPPTVANDPDELGFASRFRWRTEVMWLIPLALIAGGLATWPRPVTVTTGPRESALDLAMGGLTTLFLVRMALAGRGPWSRSASTTLLLAFLLLAAALVIHGEWCALMYADSHPRNHSYPRELALDSRIAAVAALIAAGRATVTLLKQRHRTREGRKLALGLPMLIGLGTGLAFALALWMADPPRLRMPPPYNEATELERAHSWMRPLRIMVGVSLIAVAPVIGTLPRLLWHRRLATCICLAVAAWSFASYGRAGRTAGRGVLATKLDLVWSFPIPTSLFVAAFLTMGSVALTAAIRSMRSSRLGD